MDEYAAVAEWDVSTRQTNEGFIRRTIKPALGPMKVRKVRGPILDKLYAELKRCGDLACTGRPFIEHRNVPVLTIDPRDPRPAWQQVTAALTEAIRSSVLVPGDELPSITEVSALQGIGKPVRDEHPAHDHHAEPRRQPPVRRPICAGTPGHPGPGTTTGSATCPVSAPRRPWPRLPKELFPCSSWARGAAPAQRKAFGAPDEIDQRRPGLE
jgi:hypothetical protein